MSLSLNKTSFINHNMLLFNTLTCALFLTLEAAPSQSADVTKKTQPTTKDLFPKMSASAVQKHQQRAMEKEKESKKKPTMEELFPKMTAAAVKKLKQKA